MTPTDLEALARKALEQDEKATTGLLRADTGFVQHVEQVGEGQCYTCPYCGKRGGMYGCQAQCREGQMYLLGEKHARTRELLLAKAVLVLLQHVRHEYYCGALQATQIGDENGVETVYEPCSCGLDAALAALDRKDVEQ